MHTRTLDTTIRTHSLRLALVASALLAAPGCDIDASPEGASAEDAAAVDGEANEPVDGPSAAELRLMTPAAEPVAAVGHTYTCDVDVGGASTDCDGVRVDAVEHDPGEWRATVNMSPGKVSYRRMDIYAEICDPSEYAFTISDSPTANGWGGDSGTTDHDAELQLYNTGLSFYSTFDALHGAYGNHSSLGAAHPGGCAIVHTAVYHPDGADVGVLSFAGGGSPLTIRDTQGFKLGYEKCAEGSTDPGRGVDCDYEDGALKDQHRWYFGLNRTVGSGSRDGAGVQRACVVLSDDVSVTPADCLEPEAVAAEPEGTRKTCISAGTDAEMLAECESLMPTVVGLYTSGTLDYATFWGDPCPNGTSIVPGSQFYVPGSCNALPNVGVGCDGPGSYNYEFQIGTMCQ